MSAQSSVFRGGVVFINLGDRLRKLRHARKLSLYDVERKTGLHFSTVGRYERNEREPSIEILRELAEIYEVSVSELLNDEQSPGLYQEQSEALQWLDENQMLIELLRYAKGLNSMQLEALCAFLRTLQLTDLPND